METYDLQLQPGFRFYPTEEELVEFYLRNKLDGKREDIQSVIPIVNIYFHNPWELPQMAGEGIRNDTEQWFFFIPIQDREARGGRPTRLTSDGYWKATGSPSYVYSSNNKTIGGKRTMVFYIGRAPNGKKTQWKMNEYRAIDGEASITNDVTNLKLRQEFSLCRVYKKSKCARAFDRRPAGFGIIEEIINDEAAPIISNQNINPQLVEINTSSREHNGGINTSQHEEINNLNDDLDNLFGENLLWDWDYMQLY